MIAACGEDSGNDDDRRFANEPSTRVAIEATPTTSQGQTPVPTAAPLPSPESLLVVRGAPSIVYALVEGRIEVVNSAQPGMSTFITIEPGHEIAGIASSPNGDRVAALTLPLDDHARAADVVVFASDGQELHRWPTIGDAGTLAATPDSNQTPEKTSASAITWAAEGNRLLVTLDGNQLISIDIAGDAIAIPVPSRIHQIEHAAWSPRGDTIAVLARDSRESGVIWMFDPTVDGESATQVVPPNADASNLGSVTRFSWLPDGSGFAYILAADAGSATPGGQLYTLNLKTGIKLLVATPGRGGPAALIVDFILSPDGKSTAYTIAIPNGDQWVFDSLWIRSLRTANRYQVPIGAPERILQVWWGDPGIVWMQQTGSDTAVLLKSTEGEPQRLLTIVPDAEATPLATPGATPVSGTPGAGTPVPATPDAATPPAATPDVGTPAQATPRA